LGGGVLEAREYKLENFVVVELRGRVDEFNTGVLRDELHTIINTGKFLIAIDLTKTDFLSAHCLKAVLSCQQRVRKLGGNLALVGPREQVQDTISYVRLHRVMHILPNLDSAKELFQKSPEEGMQAPQKTSYFSRIVNFFFKLALMISLSVSGDRLARAESPNLPPKHQYSLEDLLQLASVQGAHAKMNRPNSDHLPDGIVGVLQLMDTALLERG
jgi:anti-anti-sigma factor